MKKIVLTVSVLAFIGAGVHQAAAGDREWATAGKILTGFVAAQAISHAVQPAGYYAPVYYSPAPCVVYQPAPVVVYSQPVCAQPVYVQPAPVYVQPAPVFVASPPVYYRPAPIVSFHVGFGRQYGHGHGRGHGYGYRHRY